ncbi:hypothetical protein TNCV_4414621 [Trichonephila clavipes]|uniref:Uncharacterized protein n=1 Tax=Trichonephila clavipes TaxID=2585209 RepID=A0A8X6VEE2_TRICX|nr:hypothetical protein TNCV_4414621 [Trichonephila clavipes]
MGRKKETGVVTAMKEFPKKGRSRGSVPRVNSYEKKSFQWKEHYSGKTHSRSYWDSTCCEFQRFPSLRINNTCKERTVEEWTEI